MVDVAIMRAVVPPSMVASESVPELSFVVIVNALVNALLVLLRVIVVLFALVVKEEVVPTVTGTL